MFIFIRLISGLSDPSFFDNFSDYAFLNYLFLEYYRIDIKCEHENMIKMLSFFPCLFHVSCMGRFRIYNTFEKVSFK